MKQKITLEIDNDTGVEFEDTTKWDCPKEGEYFINSRHKIEKSDRFSSCYHFVITPKVDHELESARKKFPDNSYFKYKASTAIYVVEKLYRDEYQNEPVIMIRPKDGHVHHDIRHCTPFPIPVWRCCESDRPKSLGKYYLRRKNGTEKIVTSIAPSGTWAIGYENASDYEWLDEGGAE